MPDFLAQSFVTDRGEAIAAVARAHQIRSPRLLRAILVPGDEIMLTFWRGSDLDAVVDSAGDHERWAADIAETQGQAPNYPIVADDDFTVAKLYGMLPAATSGDARSRTPADNQTVRNVFVIGPDKKIKLVLVYPMTTGRNFDEVLRVVDSLQLTARHKVSTPVNWRQGEDVIIAGSVSNDEARQIFGEWEEPKPCIRVVPQPA